MSLVPDRISPLTQAEFSANYGGSLLCCMVMLVVYGISVLQTWFYYLNYPKDALWMKLTVGSFFAAISAHSMIVCYNIWNYLVLTYSEPLRLIDGSWAVYSSTVISIWVIFGVELFFAKMVFQLTRGLWKTVCSVLLVILILAQVTIGTVLSVKLFIIFELTLISVLVDPFMIPMFVTRMVCDMLIAVALCVALYDSRTGFEKTLKLVRVLMIYAMNRFVLTAVIVFIQTVLLLVNPTSLAAMNIEFFTAHLYVNSLLATLNSRNHVRNVTGGGDHISANGSTMVTSGFQSAPTMMHSNNGRYVPRKVDLGVAVNSETIVMDDMAMSKV